MSYSVNFARKLNIFRLRFRWHAAEKGGICEPLSQNLVFLKPNNRFQKITWDNIGILYYNTINCMYISDTLYSVQLRTNQAI